MTRTAEERGEGRRTETPSLGLSRVSPASNRRYERFGERPRVWEARGRVDGYRESDGARAGDRRVAVDGAAAYVGGDGTPHAGKGRGGVRAHRLVHDRRRGGVDAGRARGLGPRSRDRRGAASGRE